MVDEWLSVAEAARRLGVSPDEVRQRIAAGEMKARSTNARQVVFLDGGGATGEADSAIIIQALIAELRGQIAFKDEQLKAREQEMLRSHEQVRAKDQQIERLMILLAQSQAQTQELAQRLLPPAPAQPPSSASGPGPRRRWWPLRRRT